MSDLSHYFLISKFILKHKKRDTFCTSIPFSSITLRHMKENRLGRWSCYFFDCALVYYLKFYKVFILIIKKIYNYSLLSYKIFLDIDLKSLPW